MPSRLPYSPFVLLLLVAPATRASDTPWLATSKHGMVATDSAEASQAGAEILAAGGNAFDAAIATSMALTVARPQSTGIGGGGFLIAYDAAKRAFVALDFRESAPGESSTRRYEELVKKSPDGPSPSRYGGSAAATPGLAAGWREIHQRWGTRRWNELAAPAQRLAEQGIVIDGTHLKTCQAAAATLAEHAGFAERFAEIRRQTIEPGAAATVGARLPRPEIAKTLAAIAADGPDAFYRGEMADAICRAVKDDGGWLSPEDLKTYRVLERTPLRMAYRDGEIVTLPLPSGGLCLAESLGILQRLSLFEGVSADTPAGAHLLVEAMKHAFADRARWMGDPINRGVVGADVLLNPDRLQSIANSISFDPPADASSYGLAAPPEDRGTSHFCVADAKGNVVAMTETINDNFGSLLMVPGYGIILNNEMDDFAALPGEPNLFGLMQGEGNAVNPGARPLSSMCPTLVVREGKVVYAIGASGGPRIITAVMNTLVNLIHYRLTPQAAMEALRPHHQWYPNEIYFDRNPSEDLAAGLMAAGHALAKERKSAAVQLIAIAPTGEMTGASDPRKGGRPAGLTEPPPNSTTSAPSSQPIGP
ncbi:MAG: gamma-glutamyltransferase [Phycisphaerae bacterium]|nr:gamma-glutamyltransferase [Phycisphaerae bacterium]